MKPRLLQLLKYFYKPYAYQLVGISICGILFALFESINVAVAFPIVNSMLGPNSMQSGSRIVEYIQKAIQIIPIEDKFVAIFLLFLIVNLLLNLFQYFYETLTEISSYTIMKDFQKKIYKKIISSDYQYFLDNKQGKLMYSMITAPGQMIRVFLVAPKFIVEVLKLSLIVLVLFSISSKFTFGVLLIGIVFYFLTKVIAQKISYNTGKGRVVSGTEQNVLSTEAISGIRQIKVFLASNRWIDKFCKASDDFARLAAKDSLFHSLPRSVLSIIAISILCIAAIIMKVRAGSSFANFMPVICVYFYAFLRIIPSISLFGQMHMQFMGGLPYAETVYNELHTDSHRIKDGKKAIDSFDNSIRFVNLSFRYPGRQSTLKDINITFEKGKVTALVGPSGAGKSTVIDLIVRLYEPADGKILIDGYDMSSLSIYSWRKKIGFVSQDTFIFNSTIADNISFGLDNCSFDEIAEAARVANAHNFISALPEGYKTIVGDRGLKLSGGERQRIAIARAIIRNPEILIFDEATSSLDGTSERIVQGAIDAISKSRTVIMIAHRLSTVINADKIIVMDNGRIVEEGTHKVLMENKRLYWHLYKEQVSS